MSQRSFTQWQPNYSVGHAILDGQHKKLLDLCSQAISCIDLEGREGIGQFHAILNELCSYVNEHFRTEEALLKNCGYPLLEQHREEHWHYQLQLTDYLLAATLGDIDKHGLSHYLSGWWSEHILGSDMQYAPSLKELQQ